MKLYGNRVVLLKEWSKFFGLQQRPNQSRMQFANYLRHMASSCDFDQFSTEAALVVQFVNGIRNQSVKLMLLAKGNDQTPEDALNSLQIAEDIQREDSKSSNEAMDAKTCHAVKTYPPKNNVDRPLGNCDRCGKGDQGKDACPFVRFRCFNCGRTGHLSRMCRHRKTNADGASQRDRSSHPDGRNRTRNQVQCVKSSMLRACHDEATCPFTVQVVINGHQSSMELDTGARVAIADSGLWQRIGCPTLSAPTVQLRSFTGHRIPLKGS
uniref:CCHC-type domain-containing protein n=1 Tax=Trichuris muris TaxID=70415 RepID=A0A5S6PYV2_TRIMR